MFPGQGLANQSNMGLNAKQAKQGVGGAQFASYEERERTASGGQVLYGLDKELAEKAAAKFDPAVENECRAWIEAVTGEKLGASSLQEELKTGVVLCNLIIAIKPGLIKPPSTSKMPFKQMENIAMYLDGCTQLGVPSFSSFQTVSLFENKDMGAVVNNIQALGSAAQKVDGYSGPVLGTKIAEAAPRQFTQQQLQAGKTTQTFLGKGSHGQASAAGMVDHSKNVNRLGHVSGVEGLGSAGEPTFLGTGSHVGGIPGGAPPLEKRISGEFSSVAAPKRNSNASEYSAAPTRNSNAGFGCSVTTYTKFEDAADAQGNVLYGLDKELAEKAAAKYDTGIENECRAWIEAVTGDKLGACTLQEELKDGVVLCNLINVIKPGATKKPSSSAMPFKQMENISMYLEACRGMGVADHDLFQTVALYENKDMLAVLTNLQSLGRVAQKTDFRGPTLGAKLATANARDFTEEQLAAGMNSQTFIGAGSRGRP